MIPSENPVQSPAQKLIFSLKEIDLVFGKKPGQAFKELDAGKDRDEIQKTTGQVVAVHGVTLDIYQGEILVLMGLSGSGKSSLIRCLNGMNGRSGRGTLRGTILFHDSKDGKQIPVNKCPSKDLRKIRRHTISMVFQQFGLMPWRTVLENITYPLELQGIDRIERIARAEEKLNLVGLLSWKNRFPGELSGGMQQRVGLARAFVTDAEILLMDEPFSALDPIHRKNLQEEVLNLQKLLKKTIVFVSHDFSEAVRLADRIAVLQSGRVLQVGESKELIKNPSCEAVSQFVASTET